MMNGEEPELSEKARELLNRLGAVENYSSRGLRNKLSEEVYNEDYDIVSDYDVGIIESLTRHFLDLIESPKNPISSVVLERTAAVYTTIVIINQLFLSVNGTVELGWLEREYYAINKAKWDGVLFKVCNHKVSAGFVEFSGGANDRTSIQKEKHDIQKLYKMMIEMLNGYPSGIKKQVFCLRYYDNTIFFEKLVKHKDKLFRIQQLVVTIPTTVKLLLKFISQIPQLLTWRNAIIDHVDQFE